MSPSESANINTCMCTIIAKYFQDTGWVLAKNRDQDYVSDVSFHDEPSKAVGEVLTLYDNDIKYQEGMNHAGMVIITTSLTPVLLGETNERDGKLIRRALEMKTPEEAAKFFVSKKMTGYIFIGTPQKLLLVEAARADQGKGKYDYTIRGIPKKEILVRTNHGVDLKWAGFQRGVSDNQDRWRESSEKRMAYAEKGAAKAKNAEDLLNVLAAKMDDDLQMNVFRVENKPRQMRTIFQWAFVPSQSEVLIRPIQAKFTLDVSHEKIHVKMLDNEPIKKIYNGRVKHFSKIKVSDDGKKFKTQTEGFYKFKDYLNTI